MTHDNKAKPYKFIHDINLIYHKFHGEHWFYPATGYSEEFQKRNGWKFDGQIFYKGANR